MKLIFATNNQHKVDEIRASLNGAFEVISLKEAGIDRDIPEPFDTLEANASQKSKTINDLTRLNCFSEDTGLEVVSLNGEPGVKSARYAEGDSTFNDIVDKVLIKMQDKANRNAKFRTVISLIYNETEYLFEGICEGEIIRERRGKNGFGYDPIFIPNGADRTFAEMTLDEKKQFSHRAKALSKLVDFLKRNQNLADI